MRFPWSSLVWGAVIVAAVALSFWLLHRHDTLEPSIVAYMARFDADHDGVLSLGEWQAHGGLDRTFTAFDLDGDGVLEPAEFQMLFLNVGKPVKGPRSK